MYLIDLTHILSDMNIFSLTVSVKPTFPFPFPLLCTYFRAHLLHGQRHLSIIDLRSTHYRKPASWEAFSHTLSHFGSSDHSERYSLLPPPELSTFKPESNLPGVTRPGRSKARFENERSPVFPLTVAAGESGAPDWGKNPRSISCESWSVAGRWVELPVKDRIGPERFRDSVGFKAPPTGKILEMHALRPHSDRIWNSGSRSGHALKVTWTTVKLEKHWTTGSCPRVSQIPFPLGIRQCSAQVAL